MNFSKKNHEHRLTIERAVSKTKITLLALLITAFSFAQNGINYKAVIKDGLGNVVANQPVTLQFTILKGVAQSNVYSENHPTTTDNNGIAIVNIGEGTLIGSSPAFNTIDWGSDDHFLNVKVTIGGVLTNMGTSEFKAVPYALSAANVSGLEALDEGTGIGWRLKGRIPTYFGNIGADAVDFSSSSGVSTTRGATGPGSFAIGSNATAFGFNSVSIGPNTVASQEYSFALGFGTASSSKSSLAMGYETMASAFYSTALGFNTKAASHTSTAIGRYNVGSGEGTSWMEIDPLFEIGNGTSDETRSNALTVLKNGTITAPSLTNSLIEVAGPKALVTKEYVDINASSGLEAIDEGNGIGWRLIGRDPALYGNVGVSAVDLSTSSILSSTRGATGDFSIATGFDTTASGRKSTAMGESTLARTYSSTAIGSYNIGSGSSATSWLPTDPLFEIGNGVDIISRSNALTVLKNGNVGIGVANPTAKLDLNGRIKFGDVEYIEDGGSFYIAVNGSLNSTVNGLDNLGSADKRWNNVYATNGVINTSDRRDKANIADMTYGLKDVMKLKPVSFNWKDHPNDDRKMGLIAQDLLQVIPEIVKTHENVVIDENDRTKTKSVAMDRLGVYYSDLIPVLIKAIQEQQTTIENLKARLEALEKN